jgi:microsomal dipeptidase-like Zn-dependent dipeptidase
VIADLHAHLPMHLPASAPPGLRPLPGYLRDRWRGTALTLLGRRGNFDPASRRPRVSVPLLREGGVGLAFSVLYSPFDEMIFSPRWHLRELRRRERPYHWAPPSPRAFARLLRQLESVERHVASNHASEAAFVHSLGELDQVESSARTALVHCVEGAFHLGEEPAAIDAAVTELARRGVAYITIGHLYFKGVASVVPNTASWLRLTPERWEEIWPQPGVGLTERAEAAVRAMVREGVGVDLAHLSPQAFSDALSLLDELDPDGWLPVIASHTAFRFGDLAYNLDQAAVERIVARRGIVGLILSGHHLAEGVNGRTPQTLRESIDLLCRHVDRIAELAGSLRHVAIGTDLGGFIEPVAGLPTSSELGALEAELRRRYGDTDGELVASGNAQRLLRSVLRLRQLARPA